MPASGKITVEQREEIKKAYAAGATQSALANRYGVTFGAIQYILRTMDVAIRPQGEGRRPRSIKTKQTPPAAGRGRPTAMPMTAAERLSRYLDYETLRHAE